MEKILVCITPQSNGRRLIDRAAAEAESIGGELHILNVSKDDSVFFTESSSEMLEDLFNYGSKKGGFVHALVGDDIPRLIRVFVKKHEITKIVLGVPPKDIPEARRTGIIEMLTKSLKIEIIVLEREG